MEVERQESEQRRLFIQKEEELQQILKRKNKQAFLDELVSKMQLPLKNLSSHGFCRTMAFNSSSECSCFSLLSVLPQYIYIKKTFIYYYCA